MQLFTALLAFAAGAEALRSGHEARRAQPPNAKHALINRANAHFADTKLNKPAKRDVFPAPVKDYKKITTPSGVKLRYKEPGKEGVCETTPGVKSYSGYIDLAPDLHSFFWFFESRRDPANDPVSLWLNGGPGSDSAIGLFQELGPCNITEDLKSSLNPYSWNNVSNFIFLSQPFGTGFSYQIEEEGSLNNVTGSVQNTSYATPTGRFPQIDVYNINTTDLAAHAAWNIIQGFYSALPQLDSKVKSLDFNLWTESYGGHYGPAFFNYFQQQNELIAKKKLPGKHLNMKTLGIGNGIISEKIQVPQYPRFAVNNTYGIKAYNQTVYDHAEFTLHMPNGCLDMIDLCAQVDQSTIAGQGICSEGANMCRDSVEGLYYNFAGRGVYDIRHPYNDPTPPEYFTDYLNLPEIQQAVGVNLNYTESNNDIYYAFQLTGDFIYPNFLEDLGKIIDSGVRVSLYYGDADYICNWFGGEAVSLNVPHKNAAQFKAAGYEPFVVNGVEYGEVRQAGNFSFVRIYEAGHEVPYYQPEASLALFNRTISLVDLATGKIKLTPEYNSTGPAQATHTEPYVALPSSTGGSSASSAPEGPILF